jgi:hypothetical protein
MMGQTPDCLSDLRIDRLLAGDLDGRESERARAHAAGCAACSARVCAFEAARAAPAPDLETIRRIAAAVPAPSPAPRSRWRALWPSLALAAAAGTAALIVAVRPVPRGATEAAPGAAPGDATRIKGGARLGFFVKHGDAVRRGGPGEPVVAGDLVRFVVSTPRPAHLAIVGLDARGVGSVYFPAPGAADTVAAGTDVELPRATRLDDTLGPETVAAFFCERPVDLAAVRADPRSAPPGCTVDRLDWVKVGAR